jgi:hypothetical protein
MSQEIIEAILRDYAAPGREASIPRYASEIVLAQKVGDIQEWGTEIEASRKSFAKQLEQFARDGRNLRVEILKLHPLALRAVDDELSDHIPPMTVFEKHLGVMVEAARAAAESMAAGGDSIKRGRREDLTARRVAESVRRAYEALTGKAAARSFDAQKKSEGGAYVELMTRVFAALKIKSRAASQAKAALMAKIP